MSLENLVPNIPVGEEAARWINPFKCDWYDCAYKQRMHEVARGLGTKGTRAYEKTGCYECDGHDRSCPKYSNFVAQEACRNGIKRDA
jgi:uncharacterized protein YodC (DUF2158 family)